MTKMTTFSPSKEFHLSTKEEMERSHHIISCPLWPYLYNSTVATKKATYLIPTVLSYFFDCMSTIWTAISNFQERFALYGMRTRRIDINVGRGK